MICDSSNGEHCQLNADHVKQASYGWQLNGVLLRSGASLLEFKVLCVQTTGAVNLHLLTKLQLPFNNLAFFGINYNAQPSFFCLR